MRHPDPLSARIYDRSLRTGSLAGALIKAVFTGISLGVLGREALHAVDRLHYDRQRKYHDRAWNLRGLLQWEREVIDGYFAKCRSILVGAAGGGREVIALQQLGLEVDGFECHPGLVSVANDLLRNEGLKATVQTSPRDCAPRLDVRYDGIVMGWGGYMLVQPRERRIALLRQLRAHIVRDGPLLVSFFPRNGHKRYFATVALVASAVRRLQGRRPVELGDDLVPTFVHYFTEAEVRNELAAGGFELMHFSTNGYGHAVGRAV